ncbi:hypothetical protein N0V90_004623 [Kalmusia sp. IMI 367209]|nr:hypothetical protein N0V90_004623 [Kalmusia sp. IMI 367209]
MHSDEPTTTSQPSPSRVSSEASGPPAKRRRIDTSTNSRTNDTATSISASQGSGYEEALQVAEAQPHQPAVFSIPTEVNTSSKRRFAFSTFLIKESELFKTSITIEYGDKLDLRYPVHLELLCSHSSKQCHIFLQAEEQREQYEKAKSLRKQVKALSPPAGQPDVFNGEKFREKVITVSDILLLLGIRLTRVKQATSLILECLNNFPLAEYQDILIKVLADATDKEFQDNDMFKVSPKEAKAVRPNFPKEDVRARLQQLKPKAIFNVTARLRLALRNLKSRVKKNAEKDVVKAAAQWRVILPQATSAAVDSLVEWIYKGSLSFTDAEHLVQISALANKLGVMKLADACMDKLYQATLRCINHAKSKGITLHKLLLEASQEPTQEQNVSINDDPLSTAGVVGMVFKLVFQQEKPPVIVQNLVVDAIAESEDENLVAELLPVLNSNLRGHITMAVMRNATARAKAVAKAESNRPQVHSDACHGSSIKSELYDDESPGTKQEWDMTKIVVANEDGPSIRHDEQASPHKVDVQGTTH